MAIYKDRVKETTDVTGLDNPILKGAVTGYKAFSTVGNGASIYYAIQGGNTGEFEIGLGTYNSSSNTITRGGVTSSSNSDALVPFSTGTKDIFLTVSAAGINLKADTSALPTAMNSATAQAGTSTTTQTVSASVLKAGVDANANVVKTYASVASILAGFIGTAKVGTDLYVGDGVSIRKITAGSKDYFTPISISGLQCWLDASEPLLTSGNAIATSGQTVATWLDKSGNGKHATSTGTPIVGSFNGKQSVNFNGTNAKFSVAGLLTAAMNTSGMSVIVACSRRTTTGNDNRSPISAGFKFYIEQNPTTGILDFAGTGLIPGDSGNAKNFTDGVICCGFSTTEGVLFASNLLTLSQLSSDTAVSRTALSGTATFAGDALQIGGIGASFYWEGEITDVLIYNRLLTNAEFSLIRGYLEDKIYGTRKRIICIGDSITSGTGSTGGSAQSIINGTTNYPNRLKTLLGGESLAIVRSDAFPGRTARQILNLSAETSVFENFYLPNYLGKQWAIVFVGTNDLATIGSGAGTFELVQQICSNAMSVGYKVLVVTTLPRTEVGISASFEAMRQASNQNLRQNFYKFADKLLDLDVSVLTNSNDTTYFYSDKIHLNDNGYAVLAGLVYTAIS